MSQKNNESLKWKGEYNVNYPSLNEQPQAIQSELDKLEYKLLS